MSGAQVWELGVIHGRFQVLHNDHVRYLLAGRARCRHLVVGITNPDPTVVRAHGADPGRHTPEANPLTYWERYRLVRAALGEQGVPPDAFSIVPFPVNVPELYRHYVPLDAVFFLTIYDEWGRHKLETFRGLGLRTHVLWDVPPEQKGLSAADIREAMARGEAWEDRVPASVAGLLKAWGVPARLRALYGGAPEASGPG